MSLLSPILPDGLLILHLFTSSIALALCIMSFIALSRTKRTPRLSRILSMGLLVYDCLFLISANGGKFLRMEDSVVFRHLTRGFQIAANFVVQFMLLERLFVINWPYLYFNLADKGPIVCRCAIVFSFLQYELVIGLACFARGKIHDCKPTVYYICLSIICLISSVVIPTKLLTIIRQKKNILSFRKYRSTVATLLYLLNSAGFILVYVGLSAYSSYRSSNDTGGDGFVMKIVDFVYIANSTIDPLIHVLWFKETRFEVLKMIAVCWPCVKPTIQKMHIDIFSILEARTVVV